MQAECNNSDCGKANWNLQKHPSEYSRGVTCPECGTTDISVSGAEETQPQPQSNAQLDTTPQSQQAVQSGMEVGNAVGQMLQSGDTSDLYQAAAGALFQFGEQRRQQVQQQQQAAEQMGEVSKAQQYPECPECGEQITRKPANQQEFPCPNCGTRLVAQ